ncbi:MAG: glycosyltransferase family 1 protein [Leptolyngbya sp. PLA1]|nr:glycosyltransferase family 1 protein [Leptolyngbya sp. PLA1]
MTHTPPPHPRLGDDLNRVLDRVSDLSFELAYTRNSSSFRAAQSLRKLPLIGSLRSGRGTLRVRATGRRGAGPGTEVWVLRVSGAAGEPGTPWDYVQRRGFTLATSMYGSHARFAKATQGELSLTTGENPEIQFQTFPWGGVAEIEFAGRTTTVDLFSEATGVISWSARDGVRTTERPAPGRAVPAHTPPAGSAPDSPAFTDADIAFLERVTRDKPDLVAIHCPRWLGISSATRILFPVCYQIPESAAIDPQAIPDSHLDRHARVLAECGVGRFVISGGDHVHHRLIMKVKALRPDAVFDVLWHGSYVQMQDDYEWAAIRTWIDGARSGLIRGIATVKAGMEQFFRSLGVPSCLLLNYVPGDPLPVPDLPDSPIHAGVWISGVSFRKCPHAVLAALKLMGSTVLHGAGMDERAIELARYFGLDTAGVHSRPLPQATLLEAMRRTHLSMYVTFSECCPMLPLESLRMGVPCLIGPVSQLFEDDAYLFDRLVVPFPDRAEVIARVALRAAEERRDILARYAVYARAYNERARQSVASFIDRGPTLVSPPPA